MKKPNSRRHLDDAIRRLSGNEGFVAMRSLLANAIVAQMLPEGVVKGGTSLKLRFGDVSTRYTEDLDTARISSLDDYAQSLADSLAAGWEGFTGKPIPGKPAKPAGVPEEYIMQPFEIKLSYLGKSWMTVTLEVGHNEINDADRPDMQEPSEASEMLQQLGFPALKNVPLMSISHQIAQKLHALSAPGSPRTHDLIDLQIILRFAAVDYSEVQDICERLFAYRRKQTWPPVIQKTKTWEESYEKQASTLDVLPLKEAVIWANKLIQQICSS